MSASEIDALNEETREIWNRKAGYWDEQFGDRGNLFHQTLVAPPTERLLALRPGERVLEIACGNGAFSRRLAELGVEVVASDFCEAFLERAKARTTAQADRVEYRLIDATDEAQLMTLGERRFDAAVCVMALMDMATIEPLFAALSRLLKPGGRFVFSLSHPCFNSTGCAKVVEQEERDGEFKTTYSVKVSRYIRTWAEKGVAIPGEPVAHTYFHRPIGVLFQACFRAGFVLDGLEEPTAPADLPAPRWFAWANYGEIPPVLVARMRLLSR
jgi:2-polyprenyl-3-methyl-5-hydroxy-6-metoxy-1,4-benzoquinol methylase